MTAFLSLPADYVRLEVCHGSNLFRTPPPFPMLQSRPLLFVSTLLVLTYQWFLLGSIHAAGASTVPLYALVVGGGPDVESNAAQIEGHVHFVAGILPSTAKRTVLFADGKTDRAIVSYADPSPFADAKRALAILLGDNDAAEPILTRAPKLDMALDGPARFQDFHRALAKLSAQAAKAPAPLLLYFAGHGTQDEKKEEDTVYDMWGGDTLKVRALAAEVARVPRTVPVVLVMAQCFSGAFAALLFRNGDPKGALSEGNIAGFFSARKDREAAGCSYATEREDYQDFSSYFFGALCGHDRFGDAVNGADYDGDGTVSLHEAFCYALIHDRSADTPICTSDVFLRRFALLPDAKIFSTPYKEAWQAGTAAQRAVLDALSEQLGLAGEKRALTVFDRLTYNDPVARDALLKTQAEAKVKLNVARQTALTPFFERWPALRWGSQSTDYQKVLGDATDDSATDKAFCRTLIEAEKTHEEADGAVENEEAALQRFATLYEHIAEARSLRDQGKVPVKTQFERLWKAEQSSLPVASH